ncbi:MAG: hypothetical protein QOH20_2702 [Mycobacterium sp.]|nr:hypothetical protein [Mycobacterium sp.]
MKTSAGLAAGPGASTASALAGSARPMASVTTSRRRDQLLARQSCLVSRDSGVIRSVSEGITHEGRVIHAVSPIPVSFAGRNSLPGRTQRNRPPKTEAP